MFIREQSEIPLRAITSNGIQIDQDLAAFIETEVLPGTEVDRDDFWRGFNALVEEFEPRNRALMEQRAQFQERLDAYFHAHRASPTSTDEQLAFLKEIGYVAPEPGPFLVGTSGLDAEVRAIPGPQLVVPLSNARYLLNAANARWVSLYDALYGTDALLPVEDMAPSGFDTARATRVVSYVQEFLNRIMPLREGDHAEVERYFVEGGWLCCRLRDGTLAEPSNADVFAGYQGTPENPDAILLKHHRLHIELVIDRTSPVGQLSAAGVSDVIVEAAITAITDAEDSVAAVDAADKILIYRNLLGLMNGTLSVTFPKGAETITRTLNKDRMFTAPSGEPLALKGTSLLLVRNVGQHMPTDMVRDPDGTDVCEALVDAVVTVLIALHDLRGPHKGTNSRSGSIYVVKPKMQGPDEVQLAVDLFARIEEMYGLPDKTIKIGIMDEERRMSANLLAAVHVARERVFFINTGFLDRTGDEIHSIMEAGPVVPKADMKKSAWLASYESRNVALGLMTGLELKGQIGKGMWTATDRMADMLDQKASHILQGASTSWVPSPTAAALHALHYHRYSVEERQSTLKSLFPMPVTAMLALPLAKARDLERSAVLRELDNNVQGILGYVVRWIDQGVGCSKVPDINGVGLMEDRATLRISSQHIANWLLHDVVSEQDVDESLRRMAGLVDAQNADDAGYTPMAPDFDGIAFTTARRLILEGRAQPGGYTEYILHAGRRARKRELSGA